MQVTWATLYLSIYAAYWGSLSRFMPAAQGWDFPHLLLFLAYGELSFGLSQGLFSTRKFWVSVWDGSIDVYLSRPLDPRIAAVVAQLEPVALIRSVAAAAILFCIAHAFGLRTSAIAVIAGVAVCVVGAMLVSLVILTLNCAAFWWGDLDSLHETIGATEEFLRIPLTVLPPAFQIILASVLPYWHVVTFPTLISRNGFSSYTWPWLALAMTAFAIWAWVHGVVWRLAVRRYQGIRS